MEGFLVIDKPVGMTSADVVYKIKRQLPKGTKIGHAGTLDPNVTGVLPLAIGRATKAFAFLEDTQKIYRVSMKLGVSTDTEDIWGTVLEESDCQTFEPNVVYSALETMVGDYMQVPPMYSAKKIDGKKLYSLARKGQVVHREPSKLKIFSLDNSHYDHPFIHFDVSCSRGTYIRTLCVDIAKRLGTLGTMTALRRLKTGVFTQEQSKPLDQLLESPSLAEHLLPVTLMFEHYPKIVLDEVHARYVCHGVKVNLMRFNASKLLVDAHYAIYWDGNLLGIALGTADGIYMKQLFWHIEDFRRLP